METTEEEDSKISTPGDFTPTYNIARGTDSLTAVLSRGQAAARG
jgi:hypothetical protein